jgi:hypothetical protein
MLGYAISWPSNIKIQRADVKCVSAFEETSAADLERSVGYSAFQPLLMYASTA